MANPICLSPLKFYDDIMKQNHRKSYAFGHVSPLIMPFNNLLPFQFVIPSGFTIEEAYLKSINGEQNIDICNSLRETGLLEKEIENYNVVSFPGKFPIPNVKYEGEYYLEMKTNLKTEQVKTTEKRILYWGVKTNIVRDAIYLCLRGASDAEIPNLNIKVQTSDGTLMDCPRPDMTIDTNYTGQYPCYAGIFYNPESHPSETTNLSSSIFHVWDGVGPDAHQTSEPPFCVESLNTEVNSGGTVYGNSNVRSLQYANLSGYTKILIEGTAGSSLRILINRANDSDKPVEISATLDNQGKAEVSLVGYNYIHLNCIKVAYGSTATTITKLQAIKQPYNHGHVVDVLITNPDIYGYEVRKVDEWRYANEVDETESVPYMHLDIEAPDKEYNYEEVKYGPYTYYSEVFCFTNSLEDCLEIEYWNSVGNFYLKNGLVSFDDNFRFKLLLKSEIGKPEYSFEEESTKRLGYNFIESQVSKKTYKFNTLVPEFICDAMRIIRLCDNKTIKSKGEEYEAITFEMEAEWQTQGDLASVTCEFETDNVITNLGGFVPEELGGDFNNDFNNDFKTN